MRVLMKLANGAAKRGLSGPGTWRSGAKISPNGKMQERQEQAQLFLIDETVGETSTGR